MATGTEAYDNSRGGETSVAGFMSKPVSVLWRKMDAAAIIAADTTLTAAAKITAGQEITAFSLPTGFKVCGSVVYVKTAGTAGGTINIGTLADTTAFDAAVDIATAAGWADSETDAQAIASGGALITTAASDANKVVVEYIADETTGVFYVGIWGVDFSHFTALD